MKMRNEKQLLLDEVKEQIERRKSFVIMRYLGLNANAAAKFRRNIAEIGGELEVVKKRILVKAAQEAGIELNVKALTGHVGIVFAGEDAVQTTKAVYQLKKETDQAVDVLGGYFDGQIYNAKDIETLSNLPGKDEMRAQLLATFEAPMARTVGVMQSLLCSVLYCLDGKAKEESAN
jgi:large subunit ribosomal protein L10